METVIRQFKDFNEVGNLKKEFPDLVLKPINDVVMLYSKKANAIVQYRIVGINQIFNF